MQSKIRGLLLALSCLALAVPQTGTARQSQAPETLPAMAWDHKPQAEDWTTATLQAIRDHGDALVSVVPGDIALFCPGYAGADDLQRAEFWAGLLSALALHESSWNPRAGATEGNYVGLVQIAPSTARIYGCAARSSGALQDGAANLSCAVRIAAAQVSRDGALVAEGGQWRGMARDWAPFRSKRKRNDIAAFTSRQDYCRNPETALR